MHNPPPSAPTNDDFLRDCLNIQSTDAPKPSAVPPTPRFEERRRWATTTLSAFGIAAVAGACYALAAAYWHAWPSLVRATFLVVATISAHVGGVFADRNREPLLAHFLYCLGAATFAGGALCIFLGVDGARLNALWTRALPPTALLVFATAQTSRSRALHFIAIATIVSAFALNAASNYFLAFRFVDWAFFCCALGAYWAWSRESQFVATVYLGIFSWTCVEFACSPLPVGAHALILICAVGLFLRWFCASYRSAFGATFGTFVAFCALGAAAFPYFWNLTFSSTISPPAWFNVATASTIESVFAAALFVLFAVRLILDGARQNVVQFALATAFFAIWLLALCVVAAVQFKTSPALLATPTTAAIVFAILLFMSRKESVAPSPRPVAPDALDDDQELDDLFDAEARAGSTTPRLSSISTSLDHFWDVIAQRYRFPAYVVSVFAQALTLVSFAFVR